MLGKIFSKTMDETLDESSSRVSKIRNKCKFIAEIAGVLLALYGLGSLVTKWTVTEARIEASATVMELPVNTNYNAAWIAMFQSLYPTSDNAKMYDEIRATLSKMGESSETLDKRLIAKSEYLKNPDKGMEAVVRGKEKVMDYFDRRLAIAAIASYGGLMRKNEYFSQLLPPRYVAFISATNNGRQDAERFTITVQTPGAVRDATVQSDGREPMITKSEHAVTVTIDAVPPGTTCRVAIWMDAGASPGQIDSAVCSWKDHSQQIGVTTLKAPGM